jgi:hypothetical protein
MRKTFCDCCGRSSENFRWANVSFPVPKQNPIKIAVLIDDDCRFRGDICEECVIEKVIKGLSDKLKKLQSAPKFEIATNDRLGILASAIEEATAEAFKAQDKLTKEQFVEALMQAIKSGDFMKYVRVGDHAQAVVYLPYQREQELETKNAELEAYLDTAIKLLERVVPCTQERNFRSASIDNLCTDIELFCERIGR